MNAATKAQHALALAARGFRVFPLSPGSKIPPKDFAWKAEATTDPAKVERWWRNNPDYNVGVATGAGTLVVDADCKKDAPGLASLDLLDMMGLPDSYRVKTPSGGLHVYLKSEHAHGNRVDSLDGFAGIDIRCEGGYVVGPGSVVDGQSYAEVGNTAVIDASPDWFDTILLNSARGRVKKSEQPLVELDLPSNIERAKHYLIHNAPEAIEGAGGDETTYRVAARCRDLGVSEGQALELMLEHWNEQKASPPWMPDELERKIGNAFTYATGGWGSALAAAEFDVLDIDVGVRKKKKKDNETTAPGGEILPPEPRRLKLVRGSSLAKKVAPDREWFVPGLIPNRNVSMLYGDGGTGKSLLALQLAIAAAAQSSWLRQPVATGKVLFISAEDEMDELHRRLRDIAAGEDIEPDRLDDLRVMSLAGEDALLAVTDGRTPLRPTGLFEALDRSVEALQPRLVVLDTLADLFGGEENNRAHARQFVGLLRGMSLRRDTTVLVLAHPSLSGMASGSGQSGSTGWNNSVRSRLYFERIKNSDGVEDDPDVRILRTMKSNCDPACKIDPLAGRIGVQN